MLFDIAYSETIEFCFKFRISKFVIFKKLIKIKREN